MLNNVLPLSFIVGTRFFGLFIVLPVLSLYALKLEGANEFLVGLLVGVYALTQMILQMPFGILSDKIGRKKNHAHWTDYFYNRLFNLLFCRKYLHHAFRENAPRCRSYWSSSYGNDK